MNRLAFFTFILFSMSTVLNAQEFSYYLDGHKLLIACESDQPYAYGIITGIHDALSETYAKGENGTMQVCAPDEITIPEIKKAICLDLEEHENIRRLTAVQVVWSSMLIHYPCS